MRLRCFLLAGFMTIAASPSGWAANTLPPVNLPQAALATAKAQRTAEDRRIASALELLSQADIERYQRIYELQKKARWGEADKLMAQLENDVLKGQLLYQRYMHPHGYKASYSELAKWMSRYPDMPGAIDIYAMAQKRRKRGSAPLLPPVPQTSAALAMQKPEPPLVIEGQEPMPMSPVRNISQRREISRIKTAISDSLKAGELRDAEQMLMSPLAKKLLSKPEYARSMSTVANAYYYSGNNDKALALATISAPQMRGKSPRSDWVAGLAAWKLGRCDKAAMHFEEVARDMSASRWQLSAGAFWAARARLACHEPERVNELLRLAAVHSRTFYGLIAARQLGENVEFIWDLPPLAYADLDPLMAIQGVRRAVALTQLGQREAADVELRIVWQRYPLDLHEKLLGLASRLNLPTTQVKVAKTLADASAAPLDSALYPLPDWQPRGGYSLDRALLFAIMRQESEFNPRAKSAAGALGLMQLMPQTAVYMGRDRTLKDANSNKLYEPDFNMELGQRYITYLLENSVLSGNLFLVAPSYNAGPGNVSRWMKKINFQEDPLLFIESIPLEETRDFAVRVISNLWLYQMRIGHPTPSLDQAAAGEWPMYQAMEKVSDNSGPATEGANARN